MIYTNNNGPREWCNSIIGYFEEKINYKIIDQVIAAFKINGKRVEICRTSHNKTHKDLIRCTKIPANSEICFLDDSFHPEMANDNIYYINLKPYYYDLPFEEMLERFKESHIYKQLLDNTSSKDFDKSMNEIYKLYKYDYVKKNPDEYEVDKILGKKIMLHLQEFFNKTKKPFSRKHTYKNTHKHNKSRRNKTQKKY